MINLDSILKKQRYYFTHKGPSSQSYGFSSSKIWMWVLYYKESWVLKNWCFFFLSMYDKYIIDSLCGVGEDNWESLGLQGDPTSPS